MVAPVIFVGFAACRKFNIEIQCHLTDVGRAMQRRFRRRARTFKGRSDPESNGTARF
jgi:hypothetical protein